MQSTTSSGNFRPGQTTSVDLSEVFKAVQLSTSLDRAQNVLATESAAEAFEQLSRNRFDQAPVTDEGRVVGSVLTADLAGATDVASVMTRLEDCPLLSMDAPLSVLLSALADAPMVFLVGSTGLQAFVTPSDLERHAAAPTSICWSRRSRFCSQTPSTALAMRLWKRQSRRSEVVGARLRRTAVKAGPWSTSTWTNSFVSSPTT